MLLPSGSKRHTIVCHNINTVLKLCFLSLRNCFCFSEAEDIKELNHRLHIKQQEVTTLETNRRHQKDTLRKREEDLRGMLKNLIAVDFG